MKQLQPVLWRRGVLLAPQHLQMQDRFLEDAMQFRLSALTNCRWGFQRLEIDEEALASGRFLLRSASGVFPDGLLFDFPAADVTPPPKTIGESWQADETAMTVFLAVPEYRDGGSNVAGPTKDSGARYISDMVLRRDENTGLSEKPIEVARKNLRLLVGNETHEGHSTLAAARVIRGVGGSLQLDPSFVPPVLDISASRHLMTIASELLERLSAESTALSVLRRQRNQSLADFSITGIANFWLLYTVNSHIPAIKHLLETRQGHPGRLFEAMLGLAGSLTTFSGEVLPHQLVAYDHNDLGKCFTALAADITRLLDSRVLPIVSLMLRRADARNVHVTMLDDERYLRADELYLAVHADVPDAELVSAASDLKVASLERVEHLVKQALPGLPLKHTSSPPNSVPVKLDYQYFRVRQEGPAWSDIRKARSFAVHSPASLRDARFELVIVLPSD